MAYIIITGFVCLILAGAILYMDYKFDQQLYNFFGVNPLNSYDEVVYLTKQERLLLRPKKGEGARDIPLIELNEPTHVEDDDVEYTPLYIKRRTVAMGPKVLRTNKPRHLPSPPPVPTRLPHQL